MSQQELVKEVTDIIKSELKLLAPRTSCAGTTQAASAR